MERNRPIVVDHSRQLSVDLSLCVSVCVCVRVCDCLVHCGKTADRVRMPFGMVGRTVPWTRQVVGFGDRSTGRGNFGANMGCAIVTNGDSAERNGPSPKLLLADLFNQFSLTSADVTRFYFHCAFTPNVRRPGETADWVGYEAHE